MSRLVTVLALAACLGPVSVAGAAAAEVPQQLTGDAAPTPPYARAEGERVTIAARDADLGEVLAQLAASAEFELTTSGHLGRVTADFSGVSIEYALRRLAQDYELMLVYSPAGPDRASRLVRVDLFPRSPSFVGTGGPRATFRGVSPGLAEIGELSRMPGDPRNMARLMELARNAPELFVRVRAVSILARVGAPAAATLLGALGDQAPQVRMQAVYALRNIDRALAIPAIGRVLVSDPDVTVRRAAARMLRGLQDPMATSMLSAATGDSDFVVRREATRALQRGGVSPAQ